MIEGPTAEMERDHLAKQCEVLMRENDALRDVVNDMLAGLAYLRSTDRVPYGFGIDRLERTGRAALSYEQSPRAGVANAPS